MGAAFCLGAAPAFLCPPAVVALSPVGVDFGAPVAAENEAYVRGDWGCAALDACGTYVELVEDPVALTSVAGPAQAFGGGGDAFRLGPE